MTKKTYILHDNDPDGFTSAWLLEKAYPSAELIPVEKRDLETIKWQPENSRVFIVDTSFPREQLEALSEKCELKLLDHHITARKELDGLSFCKIDTTKAACAVVWNYLHAGKTMPAIVAYVQDHDLWRKELPYTDEINAYISSYEFTIDEWDKIDYCLTNTFDDAIYQGGIINRYKKILIKRILKNVSKKTIVGYEVNSVNSPVFISEIGNILSKGSKFAHVWYDAGDHKRNSLRSSSNFDVSELAKTLGGGGHKSAAGWIE